MTIQNQLGQTGYSQYMEEWLEGQPTAGPKADSKVNPNRQKIATYTIAGTATDGTYTATATHPDTGAVASASVVRATTPATNDDIAAALAAAINASSSWRGVGTATVATNVVTVTFDIPGQDYTLGTAAPAPGTNTAAETQAPGGTALPFGRFVVSDTTVTDGCALPGNSAAPADIIGCTIRSLGEGANAGAAGSTAVDSLANTKPSIASANAGPSRS